MFFFFQAEDGIRDIGVTGVQTCALPIFPAVPLHSWLLDVYVSSPTSTNVVLSGVLPKLGTYGLIRIAIPLLPQGVEPLDRKSTRLNSSHANISYAVFCLKKKINFSSHIPSSSPYDLYFLQYLLL